MRMIAYQQVEEEEEGGGSAEGSCMISVCSGGETKRGGQLCRNGTRGGREQGRAWIVTQ